MDPAVRAAHLVILFVGRDAAWQRADEVGTVTSVRGNEFGGGVVGVAVNVLRWGLGFEIKLGVLN